MQTEPTSEQCLNREVITIDYGDGPITGMACWYPQMGGYGSHCLVEAMGDGPDPCFDAYIWHDGEFPFHEGERPVMIHHCQADQFIRFGQHVQNYLHRRAADAQEA